jgi:hypothetical protein
MSKIQPSHGVELYRREISIRSYDADDRPGVFRLLSFLPNLYPRGFDWLERRLTEVERQKAYCSVALVSQRIAGILIDTPKGARTSKVSTLFVKQTICRAGIGSLLFETSMKRWRAQGTDSIYITVASIRKRGIETFLQSNGFTESAYLRDHYGTDRHELVYSLKLG